MHFTIIYYENNRYPLIFTIYQIFRLNFENHFDLKKVENMKYFSITNSGFSMITTKIKIVFL